MTRIQSHRRRQGFTIIEVLVVVLIIETIMAVALPSYINSVYTARQGIANANARALATSAQGKAITAGVYDTVLSDYAVDMGGSIPMNPCTGTTTGYSVVISGLKCLVSASAGTNCGTWAPTVYSLGYSGE